VSKWAGIPREDVEAELDRLDLEAASGGYHLNPDREFTLELVAGLLSNERRFGYRSCPCRLASGRREDDLDIVCPCDYRDADLGDWGACYCALYVSDEALRGERAIRSIPERRPSPDERSRSKANEVSGPKRGGPSMPVWRCRVCGYLCARDAPPDSCPICKVGRDRFERFW